MIRLIKEELKKLLDNKLNWLLVGIMIFYPWMMTYKNYHDGLQFNNMIGRDGLLVADESQSELQILQELDAKTHELAGPLNQAKVDELYQKGINELKKIYILSNLDDDWMKITYGENYLDFIERGSQGQLTKKEISQLPERQLSFQNDGDRYYFRVKFNDEKYSAIIAAQYYLKTDYMDFSYYLGNNQFSKLQDARVVPSLVMQANRQYFTQASSKENSEQQKIASELEKEKDYVFDSIYPNEFLEEGLSSFNFILLLLLSFMTSNIFYVEKQRKTEPILFATKYGKQLFKAKLYTGLLLALMIALITIVGIFIQSYLFLPVRDFGLYGVMGNGYFHGETKLLFTFEQLISVEIMAIILCYLVVAMMTMGISCISKNAMVSFGSMIIMLIGPEAMTFFQKNAILKGLLPNFTVDAPSVLGDILGLMPFNHHLYFNVYLGWLIYLVLGVIIFVVVNHIGKKHQA